MRMQLSIRNVSAVIANIKPRGVRIQRAVTKRTRRAGEDVHAVAYSLCPVDTGFMQDHLVLEFTPKGLGFEIGWKEEDFFAAGLDFYPPYVVFGVEPGTDVNGRSYPGQAAQDPLTPAYNQHVPGFVSDLAAILRREAAR